MIFFVFCMKKLENDEQSTFSGKSGSFLILFLPIREKASLKDCLELIPKSRNLLIKNKDFTLDNFLRYMIN